MSDRIGSAEWINPEAVAEKFSYEQGSFWLGRTIDREAKAIGIKSDEHILIVAPSHPRIEDTLLVNNLCLWPGSAAVIDRKGDLATITAARRAGGEQTESYTTLGMGQAVHVLDPYGVADVPDHLRATFNPLDWLDPDDPFVSKKAERLATSLMPVKEQTNDYLNNEAQGLLGNLFLHVATEPMYEGNRHLMTIRNLVMRGDISEHVGGEVKASAKLQAYVRGAVQGATDFIDSEGMQEILKQSSFSFSEFKSSEKGGTVYLCIPPECFSPYSGWMRMMVNIVAMQAKFTREQPRCGYPTLMLLDDFTGLERMVLLEQGIEDLAGHGVKMVFRVHSLGEIKSVYRENWETFINGVGIKIFSNVTCDHFTQEYISKQFGIGRDPGLAWNTSAGDYSSSRTFSGRNEIHISKLLQRNILVLLASGSGMRIGQSEYSHDAVFRNRFVPHVGRAC